MAVDVRVMYPVGAQVVAAPQTYRCRVCEGRGWVVRTVLEPDGVSWPVTRDCGVCEGTGRLHADGTPVQRQR